ncbi:TonB-dependent receptor plug domain-containing protein [Aliikangiella sp. IMCC44359]|uniref:TonB-dependent receptor plug domain-containing protein n=1 Tax=Aliikangiella sp. IMCC44359 TaxID=3459125 RepID=UPI00403AA33D
MTHQIKRKSLYLAIAMALNTQATYAAEVETSDDEEVQKMVIVGSRAAPRSVSDSPVPVDVISSEELNKTGSTDMLDMLVGTVPSFNVHANPISDAATLVRPVNLRGLSSDSTLILVNGKRRHRASVIAFQGGGINDGAQGPDISVIPSIALKQVEVLRDGAAAQYGSDAIAGVMNFILKDNTEGGSFSFKQGEYYEGDGAATTLAGNVGLPFTQQGFANLSFQLKNADATSRSIQIDAAQAMADAGNSFIQNPAQIWGSPEIKDDLTVFANVGLELDSSKEFYMFGNYSERDVKGGFYWRNPHNRASIYSNDDGATLLVGDLDGVGTGIECPTINITSDNVLNNPNYLLIADNTTALGQNCFAVNEIHPGGYTPNFGGNVTDSSLAVGVKGDINSGFLKDVFFDISGTVGRNETSFNIVNTINSSMGMESPTDFYLGKYIELEKTFNVDLVKSVDIGLNDNMNVAGGFEWREESFEIVNGDQYSFLAGPLIDQGFNLGSHGFPGFQPSQAGVFTRRNIAVYVDVETYLTESLLLGGALRYEDFTTFGDTLNYKLSMQYSFTDNFSMRGSTSTGFRAPTVGQANVSNVSTALEDGELTDSALLPPTSEFSKLFGGKELDPEESESYALGWVYENGDLFLTADYYHIEVTDRITQSDRKKLVEADYLALEAIGVANPRSVGTVSFFSNDFDTTTEGLDLVANYSAELFDGNSQFNMAYNWTETSVDRHSAITGDFKVKRLEDALPKHRATFTFSQSWDNLSLFVRANYFGKYYAVHVDYDATAKDADAATTFDAEVSYIINNSFTLSLGAQNLFDQEAELLDFTTQSGGIPNNNWGGKYYETGPYGFNGGFYYLKATYNL